MKYIVTIAAEVEASDLQTAISAMYQITQPHNFYSQSGVFVTLPLRIVRVEEVPDAQKEKIA